MQSTGKAEKNGTERTKPLFVARNIYEVLKKRELRKNK